MISIKTVMIIMLLAGNSTQISTAEFDKMSRCKDAKIALLGSMYKPYRKSTIIRCVPK